MIEELYKQNLKNLQVELEESNFPTVIRLCRELMGLKQFAAAEYLGLERHRYKKIECGDMPRGASPEEMIKLCAFFHLPKDWLEDKHSEFNRVIKSERQKTSKNVWDKLKEARGFGSSID